MAQLQSDTVARQLMKQYTVDLIVNETVESRPDMLRQDTVDGDTVDGTVTIGHSRQDS